VFSGLNFSATDAHNARMARIYNIVGSRVLADLRAYGMTERAHAAYNRVTARGTDLTHSHNHRLVSCCLNYIGVQKSRNVRPSVCLSGE